MHSIGYRTIPAKHGFEIEGVSESILRRFSKRSSQRDKAVAELEEQLGRKLSKNEVAYAVHRTRPGKLKGISITEVRERQQAQLSGDELYLLQTLKTAASTPVTVLKIGCEQDALTHATAHVFERQSVVPQHELLAVALSYRPGEADLSRLKQGL